MHNTTRLQTLSSNKISLSTSRRISLSIDGKTIRSTIELEKKNHHFSILQFFTFEIKIIAFQTDEINNRIVRLMFKCVANDRSTSNKKNKTKFSSSNDRCKRSWTSISASGREMQPVTDPHLISRDRLFAIVKSVLWQRSAIAIENPSDMSRVADGMTLQADHSFSLWRDSSGQKNSIFSCKKSTSLSIDFVLRLRLI